MQNLSKMDARIREAMLNDYRIRSTFDKYGQVPTGSKTVKRFFPNEQESKEVENFIRSGESKIVNLDCYGNRYQVYYAINVIDRNFSLELSEAIRHNPNWIKIMKG